LVNLEFSNLYPGLNGLQPLGKEGPLEAKLNQAHSGKMHCRVTQAKWPRAILRHKPEAQAKLLGLRFRLVLLSY